MRIEIKNSNSLTLTTKDSIQPNDITIVPVGQTYYCESNVSNFTPTIAPNKCGVTKVVVAASPKLFMPTVEVHGMGSNGILVKDQKNGNFSQYKELINIDQPNNPIRIAHDTPYVNIADYPTILIPNCYISARCIGDKCIPSDWTAPVLFGGINA